MQIGLSNNSYLRNNGSQQYIPIQFDDKIKTFLIANNDQGNKRKVALSECFQRHKIGLALPWLLIYYILYIFGITISFKDMKAI